VLKDQNGNQSGCEWEPQKFSSRVEKQYAFWQCPNCYPQTTLRSTSQDPVVTVDLQTLENSLDRYESDQRQKRLNQ
jgi:hypothetical protein